ncbi:hypothetical protein F5B21DRAFT_498979 [Xylaria acuta]|nr:hypothetical protein F5B21DRAFT_498979 [Xylaria acuta]
MYQNIQETAYDGSPQIVSGYRCTSNNDEGCTVTESVTHTVTVSKPVNGGASGSLNLEEIFTLGVDVGFTYSWVLRYLNVENGIANQHHVRELVYL